MRRRRRPGRGARQAAGVAPRAAELAEHRYAHDVSVELFHQAVDAAGLAGPRRRTGRS
ncbi:hypothetical protein ACFXG6_00735 [Streptomyces roseus]|uniref:hypothetical protein n=1 Tax=Streptomyces roseus TaxID=66430 RepID=UPI0036C7DAD8